MTINVLLDARNRIMAAQAPGAPPAPGQPAAPVARFAPSRGQRVLALDIPPEDSHDHPRAIFARLHISPDGQLRYRPAAAPRR